MRIPVVCAARLAHYYATVKFHKLPKLQCRFITASRDTPLATPYLVLTCLLRAFARELHPMWHELGVRHGIDVGSAWFITNSSDFIPVIQYLYLRRPMPLLCAMILNACILTFP